MGVFGDVLSSAVSIWNAEQNRDSAAQSQEAAQNFNRDMAETQYQRTVKDLNAAGLSPMLAYGGKTSSASVSPVSGSSSIDAPKFGETDLREAQSEAAKEQANVAKSTVVVNAASADKLKAEADNVRQDTANKRLYPGFNEAQIKELVERAAQHGASAGNLKAMMDEIRQTINLRKPEEKFKEDHPIYSQYVNPVRDALDTIFKGVGLFRPSTALINSVTTHPDGSKSSTTTTRKGR
jgi:DNA-binding transcriptional regulator YhcF (GntR family)